MENTINYGIDLGTTNSAIAKFTRGEVKVFKDPNGWKDTIPSVVGFRKDKILVGEQAKVYLEKEPKNVVGVFKRKMGTSESLKIKSLNESKTPIELSAFVLKELKTFINSPDPIEAIVLTIPASFDTIQSNATKEAGIQAGFKQVVLLQEPIAASLAYANMKKDREMKDGQWLVYDLGGGTFDVALIKIKDKEMKVLDHEGNNFLGGTDFDRLIVEKIIIPKLEEKYVFDNLKHRLQDGDLDIKMNGKYYGLIHKAEKAKIGLSSKTAEDIEISDFKDDNGNDVDIEITMTRSEFTDLIKPYIDETIEMIKKILTRNSLNSSDVDFTLMVGGSTYIPFVRSRVGEILQIPINIEIDPTTAVAIGAAYYAGTKQKDVVSDKKSNNNFKITIRAVYEKVSIEKEELFAARITGNTDGLYYRITREDGGYNSGLKKLTEKISEDLPLVSEAFNFFKLSVYDNDNNLIDTDFELIGINSGWGNSIVQPLPEDICLEVDDYDNEGDTKLEMIFQKNSGLPNKKIITKQINKNILKGSEDDLIRINVVEGSQNALPGANKQIGYLEISGKNVKRDINKGSDIELTFLMSESRDISVFAYLNMADQEFKGIFNPQYRTTSVKLLKYEVEVLSNKLNDEIEEALKMEEYETANALSKLKDEMLNISSQTGDLTANDSTDKPYQIEDKKRKLTQEIDLATKNKRIQIAKEIYTKKKKECKEWIDNNGNDYERKIYENIEIDESSFLSTNSPLKIQDKTDELNKIISGIRWRTPSFLSDIFDWLKNELPKMNNPSQAKSLIDAGKFAIESKNWDRLREIDNDLIDLLPDGEKSIKSTFKIGF